MRPLSRSYWSLIISLAATSFFISACACGGPGCLGAVNVDVSSLVARTSIEAPVVVSACTAPRSCQSSGPFVCSSPATCKAPELKLNVKEGDRGPENVTAIIESPPGHVISTESKVVPLRRSFSNCTGTCYSGAVAF